MMCTVCGHELSQQDLERGKCPECGLPVGESPEDDWVA